MCFLNASTAPIRQIKKKKSKEISDKNTELKWNKIMYTIHSAET